MAVEATIDAPTTPARLGGIEILRLLGAFGIVVFHLGAPGADYGYAALPMFIYLTLFFGFQSANGNGTEGFALSRLSRFVVPWVIWSAVYGALRIVQSLVEGAPFWSDFALWQLFTGPSVHLWFLPYVAVISVVAVSLWSLAARVPLWIIMPVALCLATGFFLLNETVLPRPFEQWSFGVPAVLMALTVAHAGGDYDRPVLLGWATFCGVLWMTGVGGGVFQLLIASLFLLAALAVPFQARPELISISRLSIGIYILHPLVVSALAVLGLEAVGRGLGMAFGVFALSALVTKGLTRLPLVKHVI